jgi:hypothetical protein
MKVAYPMPDLAQQTAGVDNRSTNIRDVQNLIGSYRRFGKDGVAYEVVDLIGQKEVVIRVVETGESLEYPISQLLNDPQA